MMTVSLGLGWAEAVGAGAELGFRVMPCCCAQVSGSRPYHHQLPLNNATDMHHGNACKGRKRKATYIRTAIRILQAERISRTSPYPPVS